MITDQTQGRLAELGEIIVNASKELAQLLREIEVEADKQLAAAATAFAHQHATQLPIMVSYRQAHEALLKASCAASNIHEISERANSLRCSSEWWKMLEVLSAASGLRLGQYGKDITGVLDAVLAATKGAQS